MNYIDVAASRRLVGEVNPTGCPAGIEPRLWRETIERRVEQHLALVTALMGLLDGMDGDCDLEEGGDLESSLGGAELYGEVDLELDPADAEPSLGWTEMEARYGALPSFDVDLEAEHDGAEPEGFL